MRDLTMMPSFAYIVVYVCVCYYRSLDGTFVFDDNRIVIRMLLKVLWDVFVNDLGMPIRNMSNKSYRPLTTLSFSLNLARKF